MNFMRILIRMKNCFECLIVFCVCMLVYTAGQITVNERPGPPYDVQGVNVTYHSVEVIWTSGSDMGAKQHFGIISYLGNGTSTYEILASNITGPYNVSGAGQNWTYHLAGLYSSTNYRVAITAQNKYGTSYSKISAITTSKYPDDHTKSYLTIYVACFVSVSVCVSLLAFIIYLVWKRGRLAGRHVTSRTGLIQSGNRF